MKPPHNVAFLERAIRQMASSNEGALRIRTTLANAIAGQFLEGAVMRGGGSLKFRYGEMTTRYTMDFDAASRMAEDDFQIGYAVRLAKGWNGFSGRLVRKPKARPRDIPEQYVMQPFEVKLTYNNHPWCTVDLEVSYDEIGDADAFDVIPLPNEVLDVFRRLHLPDPQPIPLMRLTHQIAQKLHGLTDPHSVRPQDLIDLQLIMAHERIDHAELRPICERLFANRRKQVWPSKLILSPLWAESYDAMKVGLHVLPNYEEAVRWANELIARIANA